MALDILQHYLRDLNAAQLMAEGIPELLEPHILFGSCFPKDSQYIQVSVKNNVVLSRVSYYMVLYHIKYPLLASNPTVFTFLLVIPKF